MTSSNYPRFSINHNNGLLLSDDSYPGDNVTALNTLYHSIKYPSKFSLPVVQKTQIPEVHVLKEVEKMYPMLTQEFIAKNVDKVNNLANPLKHRKSNQ